MDRVGVGGLPLFPQRRADEEPLDGRPEGGRRTRAFFAWPETRKPGVGASHEPRLDDLIVTTG